MWLPADVSPLSVEYVESQSARVAASPQRSRRSGRSSTSVLSARLHDLEPTARSIRRRRTSRTPPFDDRSGGQRQQQRLELHEGCGRRVDGPRRGKAPAVHRVRTTIAARRHRRQLASRRVSESRRGVLERDRAETLGRTTAHSDGALIPFRRCSAHRARRTHNICSASVDRPRRRIDCLKATFVMAFASRGDADTLVHEGRAQRLDGR